MKERFHSAYFETEPTSADAAVDELRAYLGEKLRLAADAAEVKRDVVETDEEMLSGDMAVVLPGETVVYFRELFRMCLTLPQIETLMEHVDRYVASVDWAIDQLNAREEERDDDAENMIALNASIGVADNVKELLLEAMAEKCNELRKECDGENADSEDEDEGEDEDEEEEDEEWRESLDETPWESGETDAERNREGVSALDESEMDPEDEIMMLAEAEAEPVSMRTVLADYLEMQELLDEVLEDEGVNKMHPMYNAVVQDVFIVIDRLCEPCQGQISLEVLKVLWQNAAVQEQLSILDVEARIACYHTVFHNVAHAALLLNDRFNMAYGADGEDEDGESRSSNAVDALVAKLLKRR